MSNWHWKTLDVKKPWAETWLGEQVAGVESPSLKITGLQETEGDCELGMSDLLLLFL